jgi:hypothetical protein
MAAQASTLKAFSERQRRLGATEDEIQSEIIDPARAVLESGWWLPISW